MPHSHSHWPVASGEMTASYGGGLWGSSYLDIVDLFYDLAANKNTEGSGGHEYSMSVRWGSLQQRFTDLLD